MDFTPPWPPILIMALMLLLVATPPFRSADAPPAPAPHRLRTLDGLRGFLALAVVMTHGALYHGLLAQGHWFVLPGRLYPLLGSAGVAGFFMITGALFWDRLLDENGRPDWLRLYVGRLFRIAPLYLAMLVALILFVFVRADFALRVSLSDLATGIAPWLALGLLDQPPINADPMTALLTAGVTWSLRYEWLFYFALPVLAALVGVGRFRAFLRFIVLLAAIGWCVMGEPIRLPGDNSFAALFLVGAACATSRRRGWTLPFGDRVASCLLVLLLTILFATCRSGYQPGAVLLLGAAFLLIHHGCSMFGLLVRPAALRLGDISYGIYLLQGLVLAAMFTPAPVRAFALASPARHWCVVALATALLVMLALFCHAFVERPGIGLGKRLARHLPH